jgi:hypothetical protein
MARLRSLLKCVGRAALTGGARALASLVPFGETVFDIAREAREDYGKVKDKDEPPADAPGTVAGPERTYTLQGLLAAGDVADVHLARAEGDSPTSAVGYLLKVSRVPGGDAILDVERQALADVLAAGAASDHPGLPALVESFPAEERFPKRVNVFRYEPDFCTLEQFRDRQALPRDGRHLGWVGPLLLTVLGLSHRRGTLHGAVLPGHVLIDPAHHGLRLVGWGQSVPSGERIRAVPSRYRDWYPPEVLAKQPASPATDLFLAARCLIYLAGGDPVADRMPDAVPAPVRRFLTTCLLARAAMRPNDAWALRDELGELLRRLYGPPEFCEAPLT